MCCIEWRAEGVERKMLWLGRSEKGSKDQKDKDVTDIRKNSVVEVRRGHPPKRKYIEAGY